MNLEEFKSHWNESLSGNKKIVTQSSELDVIFTRTYEKFNQLARTSKLWWIVSAIGIGLILTLLIVTVLLYLWNPEQLDSLRNATPAIVLIPTFVLMVGLLYYQQAKIFDIYNCHTLADALQQTITRFKNWYRFSIMTFSILLVPVYYVLLTGISFKFVVALSQNTILSISVALTILTLVLNHLHYKRTYFKWTGQLKNNIDDIGRSTI